MKAVYEHDCERCVYLGTVHGIGGWDMVDFYYHPDEGGSLLGRFSSEPMDYISDLNVSWDKPAKSLSGDHETYSAARIVAQALLNHRLLDIAVNEHVRG